MENNFNNQTPMQTQNFGQPNFMSSFDEPKKSKLPKIITIIIVAMILTLGSIAAFIALKPRDFSYLIGKNISCEFDYEDSKINTTLKITNEKQMTLSMDALVKIDATMDYAIASNDGKNVVLEISKVKTSSLGITQEQEQKSHFNINIEKINEDKVEVSSKNNDSSTTNSYTCNIQK